MPPKRKNAGKSRAIVASTATMRRSRIVSQPRAVASIAAGHDLRVVVRERERIASLSVPNPAAGFAVITDVCCQAGNPAHFPWFHAMAQLFEKYRVLSLTYHYVPIGATSNAGLVQLSFDYDSVDPAPITSLAVTQMSRFADSALWRNFQLNVPSDRRLLFTKAEPPITGTDPKTYDMGRVYVSTEGIASLATGTTFGFLEVSYQIELINKQPPPIPGAIPSRRAVGDTNTWSYAAAAYALALAQKIYVDTETLNQVVGATFDAATRLWTVPSGTWTARAMLSGINAATSGYKVFKWVKDGMLLSSDQRSQYFTSGEDGALHMDHTFHSSIPFVVGLEYTAGVGDLTIPARGVDFALTFIGY